MTYAILFPGQGSQTVGMCRDIREHRSDLFSEASDILGWNIGQLIAEGPDELLTETDRAQPALYVTSYALWMELRSVADEGPVAAAGHSLGEYTALAAAGVFSFAEGLSLVAARGLAMADAGANASSGMAALIGADEPLANQIAEQRRADGGALYVANINAPGQIVMAGADDDLAWLSENAKALGVRRAITLKVSGGFHSPFMASAGAQLGAALDDVTFAETSFAVFANATATLTSDPRVTLESQLTSPVRFSESLVNMAAAGVDTFVHVGPGDVTAGLAKRSVPGATVMSVSSLVDARNVAAELSVE
jgi:[acyl-carrier-protein] S-malonyltransferase